MNYNEKIKFARMSKGLKANFIAGKLGVSPDTYYRIEKGQRSITLERAEQIASIIGISLIDLLRIKVSESRMKTKTTA